MVGIVYSIDDYNLPDFLTVARAFGSSRFGFVTTPNVDHLIRYHDDAQFRDYYAAAAYVLLDSQFASRLIRLTKGITLRVCTGSDLTANLFKAVIEPEDRIVLIGGSSAQAQAITQLYRLKDVHHYNPPMGFIKDPAAVDACLNFIESASPFRFCFLAVGSPQQEALAYALKSRGKARGLTLCVGASLNFITGEEQRAPLWMQRAGIEWLFRLLQNPRRLAYRYLVRGPRIFFQLRGAQIQLRRSQPATLA